MLSMSDNKKTARVQFRVSPIQQEQVKKLVRVLKSSVTKEYLQAMDERLMAFGLFKSPDDVTKERKASNG